MPASAADTTEVLLTARSVDTVRTEKDRFLGERRDAETHWGQLREQGERLKAQIAELKDALSGVNAKEKLAKKDKRDTDRIAAAAEKRQLERSLEIIEARYALRRAQIEQAKLDRDFLDASIRADDAELAIAERQTQVLPDDPSQRGVFQELTSRWLQALRTRSARAYDLEDRRFKVIEAQMELLKRMRD
jgi:chromosome segregation ATPase